MSTASHRPVGSARLARVKREAVILSDNLITLSARSSDFGDQLDRAINASEVMTAHLKQIRDELRAGRS